jgi:hypothetical protein
MPRISRFLFGSWLTCQLTDIEEDHGKLKWLNSYKDYQGAVHKREVELTKDKLIVKDTVSGFKEKAVVRWRLFPEKWVVKGFHCSSNIGIISVFADTPIKRFGLVIGYESRYYLKKNNIPVLEIEVNEPAVVTTKIFLK